MDNLQQNSQQNLKQDLQPVTFQVEEVKLNNGRYSIKGNGKSYSFFEKKQDGTESVAFQNFKSLAVAVGGTFTFLIKESQGDYQGKPITYRNIMAIKPAESAQPAQTQSAQTPPAITRAEFDALVKRVDALEGNVTPVITEDTDATVGIDKTVIPF